MFYWWTHRATTNECQDSSSVSGYAVHGSDKMALRARRVMARAKARAIVVYIYSYGAS